MKHRLIRIFVFNALDSINWRAIENDEEEISDMLATLGSLLRYSVSNIESMVCFGGRNKLDLKNMYFFKEIVFRILLIVFMM